MPDLSLIEGAAILVSGMVIGRWWPARHKGPKPKETPQPICGCAHHHSFHDPEDGSCRGMMKVPSSGSSGSYHTPCTCRVYSGPTPLPEYYAPEIS